MLNWAKTLIWNCWSDILDIDVLSVWRLSGAVRTGPAEFGIDFDFKSNHQPLVYITGTLFSHSLHVSDDTAILQHHAAQIFKKTIKSTAACVKRLRQKDRKKSCTLSQIQVVKSSHLKQNNVDRKSSHTRKHTLLRIRVKSKVFKLPAK